MAESQVKVSEVAEVNSMSKLVVKKHRIDNDNDDDNDNDKITATQTLNTAQLLLFRKEQKIRDILLADSLFNDDHHLITEQSNTSEMFNILNELSKDDAIKVVDEKSAKNRINQWKRQEL